MGRILGRQDGGPSYLRGDGADHLEEAPRPASELPVADPAEPVVVLPAIPTWAQSMLCRPIRQLWAIWQRLSILAPRPMRVTWSAVKRMGRSKDVMINTLTWLMDSQGAAGGSGGFFSTHPATGDRIEELRRL